MSILAGSIAGNFQGIIISPNVPAPTYQGNLWIKTDAYGNPISQFIFANGQWIWPHPVAPGDGSLVIFTGPEDGSPIGVWSKDGGDGTNPLTNPPTATTGAFWQVNHNMDFRFPVGAGTNPLFYNGATQGNSIAVGATGGEEMHTLIASEMWHRHPVAKDGIDTKDGSRAEGMFEAYSGSFSVTPGTPGQTWPWGTTDNVVTDINSFIGLGYQTDTPIPSALPNPSYGTGNVNVSVAHNNMPPYMGVFFIRRTARKYIVGG